MSSDDIDELSAANEFCDSFNISAKTLTFDSREHLQDYVSFFEEKIGVLYQHVENTFLGYSAEINSGMYFILRTCFVYYTMYV